MRQSYKKGDLVWYRQRDGSFTEAQVDSVDLSVQPVSYGVKIGHNYRETESPRLKPRHPGQAGPFARAQSSEHFSPSPIQPLSSPRVDMHLQPPPMPSTAMSLMTGGAEADDDFGDFSAAEDAGFGGSFSMSEKLPDSFSGQHQPPALPPLSSALNTPSGGSWSTSPLGSRSVTSDTHRNGFWSQPPAASEPEPGVVKPPMAVNPVIDSLAARGLQVAEEDDEFGSFSEAPNFPADFGGSERGKPQQLALDAAQESKQSQPRCGPIPLSIFGDDDSGPDDEAAPWTLGPAWSSFPLATQPPPQTLTNLQMHPATPLTAPAVAANLAIPKAVLDPAVHNSKQDVLVQPGFVSATERAPLWSERQAVVDIQPGFLGLSGGGPLDAYHQGIHPGLNGMYEGGQSGLSLRPVVFHPYLVALRADLAEAIAAGSPAGISESDFGDFEGAHFSPTAVQRENSTPKYHPGEDFVVDNLSRDDLGNGVAHLGNLKQDTVPALQQSEGILDPALFSEPCAGNPSDSAQGEIGNAQSLVPWGNGPLDPAMFSEPEADGLGAEASTSDHVQGEVQTAASSMREALSPAMFSEPDADGFRAEASTSDHVQGLVQKAASSVSEALSPAMFSEPVAGDFGAEASMSSQTQGEVQTAVLSASGALDHALFSEPEAEWVGARLPDNEAEMAPSFSNGERRHQLVSDPAIEEPGVDFGDWEDVKVVNAEVSSEISEQLPEPEIQHLGRMAAQVAESALQEELEAPEAGPSEGEPRAPELGSLNGEPTALEVGTSEGEPDAPDVEPTQEKLGALEVGASEGEPTAPVADIHESEVAAQKLDSLSLGSNGALDAALFSEEGYSEDVGGLWNEAFRVGPVSSAAELASLEQPGNLSWGPPTSLPESSSIAAADPRGNATSPGEMSWFASPPPLQNGHGGGLGAMSNGGGENPMRISYLDAWTRLVQACAVELEKGVTLLQAIAEARLMQEFCRSHKGSAYLQALGQLYLASQILEASMQLHFRARNPEDFIGSLARCRQAWTSVKVERCPTLAETVLQQQLPSQLPVEAALQLPGQAASAFSAAYQSQVVALDAGGSPSGDNAEEEPQWQPGLCGLCLLPLEHFDRLSAAPWVAGRPCLVILANLWTHRVHAAVPALGALRH